MKYRSEIDGLRAIAVISVIFFHAGFAIFKGGFIGVDVFFVISGYLITTIILSEKEQGIFSLVNFYERRVRRILPVLFFIMLISLPFAWLLLLPNDLRDFSQSLIAISSFSSNILFWKETGYWAPASELKPFLHTWSLAVEEQYYIMFPLFLTVMWRFRKRWIFGSFLLIAIISLLISQWAAYYHAAVNFYLLPTRAWELAIGGIIAFFFLYRQSAIYTLLSYKSVNEIASLFGLLMIVYAILVFDENTPFPSFYTLIPTIGTGLVIVFSARITLVGRLLSTKLFVVVGLISYSAYLWHQPLLAFTHHATIGQPSRFILGLMAALSFPFAYLSWKFIEQPFRNKEKFNKKIIFKFSLFAAIFFIVIGLVGHYSKGFPNRFNVKQSISDSLSFSSVRSVCGENKERGRGLFCELGSTTKNKISFAVFGDSHSEALLPAFDAAASSIDSKYVHVSLNGCPSILGVDVGKGNFDIGACKALASREFEYVKKHGIKKVFLVSRWLLYTDGDGYNHKKGNYFLIDKNSKKLTQEASRLVFEEGLKRTVEAYQKIGVTLYIVEQIPQQEINAKLFFYKTFAIHLSDHEISNAITHQSIFRNISNRLQRYNRKVFQNLAVKKNLEIINLDKNYCNDVRCLIGDALHSYYSDDSHLSAFGATLSTSELKRYIQ